MQTNNLSRFLFTTLITLFVSGLLFMINMQLVKAWSCGDTFTDTRDGKVYTTVQIGNQCWMAENMNVGTMTDGTVDHTDNGWIEKYCYANDQANCDTYGGLYQWNEAMQYVTTPAAQGICPAGWHIPTDAEWHVLEYFLKDEEQTCDPNRIGWGCAPAGEKMKENTWGGGNNSSNFTVIRSGVRFSDGRFLYLSTQAPFWSSSELDNSAWRRYLNSIRLDVQRDLLNKTFGFPIRCLKDPTIISINPVGGLYNSTQNITLSSQGSNNIYYTTDGSTPTTNSTLYTQPITIYETTTLKAISTDNELIIETHLYTMDLTQSIGSIVPPQTQTEPQPQESLIPPTTEDNNNKNNNSQVQDNKETQTQQEKQFQEPQPQTQPQEQVQQPQQEQIPQASQQPTPTQLTPQQTQSLIIQIKTKLTELIAQLIVLLQEKVKNQ